MKKWVALAVIFILTPFFANQGFGQTSEELKALREEIKALKEGQTAIQKDLQEIKNLLRTRQVQPQAPPPFKEAIVSIDAGPVLLVTALTQRDHRLLGIGAGANDYITKPIDRSDLSLRVRNAIRMRQLYLEVEEQYRKLERLELLRDGLVHMLVHDLRSPLAGIRAYLDLLKLDGAGKPKVIISWPLIPLTALAGNA